MNLLDGISPLPFVASSYTLKDVTLTGHSCPQFRTGGCNFFPDGRTLICRECGLRAAIQGETK